MRKPIQLLRRDHQSPRSEQHMTKRKINAALKKITDNELQSMICTVTAAELQIMLGGTVKGFHNWDNPTAKVCPADNGHDFLVLDDYIVDWWAKEFNNHPAILHRKKDADKIATLYGDEKLWVEVPIESDFLASHYAERERDNEEEIEVRVYEH